MVHELLHENKYLFEQRNKWFYLASSTTISTRRDCVIRGGTFVILQIHLSTILETTVIVFVDNSDFLPYTIFPTRRGSRSLDNLTTVGVRTWHRSESRSDVLVWTSDASLSIVLLLFIVSLGIWKKNYVKSALLTRRVSRLPGGRNNNSTAWRTPGGERIKTPTLKRMHPLPMHRRHADPGRDR